MKNTASEQQIVWKHIGAAIEVVILLGVAWIFAALTRHPVLCLAAAFFVLVEINRALVRVSRHLRKEAVPPVSKSQQTARKLWLAAGSLCVLVLAVWMAHDVHMGLGLLAPK